MVGLALALLLLRELVFIATGLALCHMGFRMLMANVNDGGAEELEFGTWLKLKGGGPGIVFAALGAVIIIYSIAAAGRLEPGELQVLLTLQTEHEQEDQDAKTPAQ